MYASNCPISRPIRTGAKVDVDFNGVRWSVVHGLVYEPVDELEPIAPPPPLRAPGAI